MRCVRMVAYFEGKFNMTAVGRLRSWQTLTAAANSLVTVTTGERE